MPFPMTPGGDGAGAAEQPALTAADASQPTPQQTPPYSVAPPALATALPAWDLVPPSHVLAFRRRA